MKSKLYNSPHLHVIRGDELHLSGQAVLELMQAVLTRGYSFRFKALGWSMMPFILDGDVITVDPIKKTEPKLGEVVAFKFPGNEKLIVHRIVSIKENNSLILGDSLGTVEMVMVPHSNILGRVRRIERRGNRTWLGLGPERVVIAWLSRMGCLIPIYHWLAACKNKFCRKLTLS